MRTEDLQVQRLLIEASFGAHLVACRDDMFDTLSQILREDPNKADFVDRLRTTPCAARELDREAELEIVRAQHDDIKACFCGRRPDTFGYLDQDDRVTVVCLHEAEAITRNGATLSEAVGNWNQDDWLESSAPRALFPL